MTSSGRGQELTKASDGLLALSVAEHAKEKEFTLKNITHIFAQAMKQKWPGRLYYVDPFAGPGKCLIRNSAVETYGSPLIAAMEPFSFYYFADANREAIGALRKRVEGIDLAGKEVRYFIGEASKTIDQIAAVLPPKEKSLGLAFLDPWAWDFSLENLRNLTDGRRLDILINFNIGDMKRRWSESSPKLDAFLNLEIDHREAFKVRAHNVPDARTLLDHYEGELKKIGYRYTADDRAVTNSNNTPLYHIIFGSKHELGKKLRDAVSQKTVSGQLKML